MFLTLLALSLGMTGAEPVPPMNVVLAPAVVVPAGEETPAPPAKAEAEPSEPPVAPAKPTLKPARTVRPKAPEAKAPRH
jgi:hypothetical protein